MAARCVFPTPSRPFVPVPCRDPHGAGILRPCALGVIYHPDSDRRHAVASEGRYKVDSEARPLGYRAGHRTCTSTQSAVSGSVRVGPVVGPRYGWR